MTEAFPSAGLDDVDGNLRDAFSNPRLFTPWLDPVSGVKSYILTARVAPLQSAFYFVNPSFTEDGRYCWFYCAYPPGGNANHGRSLGVIDLTLQELRHFPETLFLDASPVVNLQNGEAYWCTGSEIWKRGPERGDDRHFINRLPDAMVRNRRPTRLATHLTFSADGRALGIDPELGCEWFVGQAPLDGSEIEIWHRSGVCLDHAQSSPTDPDLMLVAEDNSIHPVSGEIFPIKNRMWLVRRDGEFEPIYHDAGEPGYKAIRHAAHETDLPRLHVRDRRAMHGHEWWSRDGAHVWYVHYGRGLERVSLADRQPELVWDYRTLSHAHADTQERWLVGDSQPSAEPDESRVAFFNRASGLETNLVSFLPQPAEYKRYHIHPHAQFCCGDRLICYTTTVLGTVDVAFTPVADLDAATS